MKQRDTRREQTVQTKTKRAPETRVNEQIRAREVLVIAQDGERLGVMDRAAALQLAQDAGYDLIEVAASATPPVCRIGDWGKMKYEQSLKERAERKNSTKITVKEIKLRPRICAHDLATKLSHAREFLANGNKVKVTVMFRGREISRPEIGLVMLAQVAADLAEVGKIDGTPVHVGRDAFMTLVPVRKPA